MSKRHHEIMVRLNDSEAAVLDQRRGAVPRATFLRQLLHQQPAGLEVATRGEALHLLSQSARDGRVQAQVALARELREAGERDVVDWIFSAEDR